MCFYHIAGVANTPISIDRNGERLGELKPLVIVEDITIAQLSDRRNFLF